MAPIVAGPGPSLALSASTPTTPRGAKGGKRRYTNGTDDPMEAIVSLTDRGFTGHEHLQEVGLVHMNGRIYDPLIARFLSADPHIQDPLNTQSLNRYTYVNNNPLAYTDPSGYFSIGKIFKSIVKFFQSQPILAMIVGIAVATVATGPLGLGLGTGLFGGLMSVQGAVIAGGVSGLLTGGPIGMLTGGAMAALTFGVGQFDVIGLVGKAILHGMVQGGYAEAQGGDFLPAFAAGAFSKLGTGALGAGFGSMGLNTDSFESIVARGVGAAVIGGTASVIGGGKFENGAATASFVYIFNALTERMQGDLAQGQRDADTEIAKKDRVLPDRPCQIVGVGPGMPCGGGGGGGVGGGSNKSLPKDYSTKDTINRGYQYNSKGDAFDTGFKALGSNPVRVDT